MEKNVKKILIVAGVIAGAAAISLTIYFVIKQKEDKDKASSEVNPYAPAPEKSTTPEPQPTTNTAGSYLIAPSFNTEGELSNSIQQLKGRAIYPKPTTEGGVNYANVRSSAEVNTSSGWWDSDNKLATIYAGNPIGTVLSDTTAVLNGYPYRWFKVKLSQPVSTFWSNYTEAFVRADTVTFKPV